ncbi:uracil-DNA glycosylase [Shewanella sp. SP1S1-7]|uniref:uracil-DNA glycosylase n=1 Tax=Shewanella sp. SP1S1-7 TaxID=3063536 RepID=UPI00289297AB|nr:uracil-DNA glycosylase [Shewanella sp. SP1S1-7]MDT3334838.1 uracil-DNA glycosylase [Shewanella sp. SP1S1-7]
MTQVTWQTFIDGQRALPYFQQLSAFVDNERRVGKVVYPPEADVFNAFTMTPLEKVKVVLIGQDPYHGPDQAHGLCFSVKRGIKPPPSLANMYKELATDIDGFTIPSHGDLSAWAEQGILMLNTVLTVEQGKAHSHAKAGWEVFTTAVLELLNRQTQPVIFVLWGSHAIKKGQVITALQHQVLTGPHPSPLSAYRGFFGCGHFSQVNQLLLERGEAPIRWQV